MLNKFILLQTQKQYAKKRGCFLSYCLPFYVLLEIGGIRESVIVTGLLDYGETKLSPNEG